MPCFLCLKKCACRCLHSPKRAGRSCFSPAHWIRRTLSGMLFHLCSYQAVRGFLALHLIPRTERIKTCHHARVIISIVGPLLSVSLTSASCFPFATQRSFRLSRTERDNTPIQKERPRKVADSGTQQAFHSKHQATAFAPCTTLHPGRCGVCSFCLYFHRNRGNKTKGVTPVRDFSRWVLSSCRGP